MPALSRQGDNTTTGGKIMRGASSVFANGLPVGLHVSQITPHEPWGRKSHPPHRSATTQEGSPTVFCEGLPVLRVGSGISCGHTIVQGSDDISCP